MTEGARSSLQRLGGKAPRGSESELEQRARCTESDTTEAAWHTARTPQEKVKFGVWGREAMEMESLSLIAEMSAEGSCFSAVEGNSQIPVKDSC